MPGSNRLHGTPREHVLLGALLVVQAAMLVWIDWRTAPTWDEWGHLPSGLYHVQYSEFTPYSVNPPLVRSVAALPLVAWDEGLRWIGFPFRPGSRPEWVLRLVFLQTHGERCFELFSWARMALIPGSWLGTYLLWSIGRRLYGAASGWVAAMLWAFSPMALTFGATVAPDVWGATFGFLAAWRFYVWLAMRTWKATIGLGMALGLAMLCKSTWIILPPLFIVLWIVDSLLKTRSRSPSPSPSPDYRGGGFRKRRRNLAMALRQGFVAAFVAWLVIHACYDFQGVLQPLGQFEFHSRALTGHRGTDFPGGNRFAGTWLGMVPAPLPADYVQGIDIQKADFEGTRQSYLFGEWQDHGWWYYYVMGIPLKEPVALGGLFLLLIIGIAKRKQPRFRWREAVLFAPGVAVLLFVSAETGFSHHIRYVLPFYPCLYLLASRAIAAATPWIRIAGGVFTLWYAVSSAMILPHSHAFFSEAIGGSAEGWRYLSDSNLDWGQDLVAIRDWARENPDKRPLWLLYSPDMLDFKKLGIDASAGFPMLTAGLPRVAGWWAVCASPMTDAGMEWFQERPATVRLTPTLKLIHVTGEDLEAIHVDQQTGGSR